MTTNRWGIALAGVVMQIALGAVYAWSVFRAPLAKQFGWSIPEVTLTFTISIFVLGIAAFFGGLWLNRKGPRIVALTGGFLYGAGVFLASFSDHKLWWLYLSYGVIGGIGLGLSYIVPVAVLVKWFPDRRGLITGVAVGGFGAGALITAPVATRLIQAGGVLETFAYLGIAYLILTVLSALFMQNPPDGWRPPGWSPTAAQVSNRSATDYSLREALRHPQWVGSCIVGVGIRVYQETRSLWGDVSSTGAALLDPSKQSHRLAAYGYHVSCLDVLRRWIRDHAGLHCGLLRLQKCGPHLWAHADGVGLRQRIWATTNCLYAAS